MSDIKIGKTATLGEEQIIAAIRAMIERGAPLAGDIVIESDGSATLALSTGDTEAAITEHLLRGRLVVDGPIVWDPAPQATEVTAAVPVTDKARKPRAGKAA